MSVDLPITEPATAHTLRRVAITLTIAAAVFSASCARFADRSTTQQLVIINETFHVGMPSSDVRRSAAALDGCIKEPPLASADRDWNRQAQTRPKGHCGFELHTDKPSFSLLALGETIIFWFDDQDCLTEVWWACQDSLRADQSLLVDAGLMDADGLPHCQSRVADADGVVCEELAKNCFLTRQVRFLPPAAPLAEQLDRVNSHPH